MIADEGHNRPIRPYSSPLADYVFRAHRMGSPFRTRESASDPSKIILSTPLLAAEGFVILKIQIQGARTVANPSSYGQLADQTGEFA